MKLFEVLFLFESDDLFTNQEHDKKTAKLKLKSIEQLIDNEPEDTDRYKRLIKHRIKLLTIIKDNRYQTALSSPGSAYFYAKDVLKGRWVEAEHIIKQNNWFATLYARDVIKGRWLDIEPTIVKDAQCASNYALNILGGRWLDAEPTIIGSHWQDQYLNCLKKKGITI
jgi:hypothetical protein